MATTQDKAITSPNQFRQQATTIAYSLLRDWVGEERAKEATGRIAVAVSAAAAAARDPKEFYRCTPQSVATCIAISALTGIMPSTGSAALAYLVPQPARKGEPPLLQYQLSHRGLNALARRCGQQMLAIPVGNSDEVQSDEYGMMQIVSRDIDDPPTEEKELRGVMVLVRELSSGAVVAQGWVPKKLIELRKTMSRSARSEYSPWAKWYVEMAMKTAMHYAINRGWCVIDDTEAVRALKSDAEQDLIAGPTTIDEKPARGIAGLKASLPQRHQEEPTQPAIAVSTSIEVDFREQMQAAASIGGLNQLKREILGCELGGEVKSDLLDAVESRIAEVEAEAEAEQGG